MDKGKILYKATPNSSPSHQFIIGFKLIKLACANAK
jgi:hypothetical protein